MTENPSRQTVLSDGSASPEIVVDICGLRKSYGDHAVLKGVDLRVGKSEVVSILGQSGGGKTTLLRCINLLEIPDAGTMDVAGSRIFDEGRPIRGKNLVRLRRNVGMVFQSFHLFPHLTAAENVILPLMQIRELELDSAIRESLQLLDRVGMVVHAKKLPNQLSGGQQQRIAIARALALKPKALLFDEPTSALDPESTLDVLKVMKDLSGDGMTMIVVTHELRFATEVADRIVLVDGGLVIEDGPPHQVSASTNPRTASFFQNFG
ncbi:Polar amino acid transport system ATP-binding protein OS=Castellaniella defragrans OX=75697 GN=HNR28_002793 PE=3 SV=1 [Castellaniella defragrans]